MPFEDDSFDIVIAGWVLAYSKDNQKVADEMLRVARPSAHVAIGCATEPIDAVEAYERAQTATGGVIAATGDGVNTMSCFFNAQQILRLFAPRIDTVIFQQDPHPAMLHDRANTTVVFRLKP
jgi:ubiquinone/menaquinone biosynthesis C-methylase UbiE